MANIDFEKGKLYEVRRNGSVGNNIVWFGNYKDLVELDDGITDYGIIGIEPGSILLYVGDTTIRNSTFESIESSIFLYKEEILLFRKSQGNERVVFVKIQ